MHADDQATVGIERRSYGAVGRNGHRGVGRTAGVFLVIACLGQIVSTVHAQEGAAPVQQAPAINFNIGAQPLGSALNAFAEATGWQVSFPTELAADAHSSGVSGSHTPEEALQTLLAGTGLKYRLTGEHAVTLIRSTSAAAAGVAVPALAQPAPVEPVGDSVVVSRSKPVKVPEIVVKDVKGRDERSYTADESSGATRIPAPIQEIPRSIEVVTRQVMDDQKVIRLQDALRNVSGVSMPNTQGGRAGDFMIRGFATDLNVFKNGFREDSTFGARASRDTVNLESIEVIKGPPSYLYGRSDPGGVIVQTTKAPLKTPYYSAEMIFGSYNLYRPTADIGGPLNESKTLTYRFNGAFESAQSFREGVKTDRIFLAPTIGWEISPRTYLRFEGEYLHDRSPIDRGLVTVGQRPADIPINSFLGDPDRRDEINQGKATLILTHQFNDAWKWRTGFRSAVASDKSNSLEAWFLDTTDNRTVNLAAFRIPSTVQSHYLQNEVHGQFATGSLKHRMLVGVELGREVVSDRTLTDNICADAGTCTRSTIDLFNTNLRNFQNNPLGLQNDTTSTNGIIGVFAGDQVAILDTLHLNAGGRFDIFKQEIVNRDSITTPGGSRDQKTDYAFSPSIGLTYQLIRPIAVFVNYTNSFAPQAAGGRTVQGKLLDPERGRQYEAGVKFQTEDGRLRSTVAIFDIKKKNVSTSDPADRNFQIGIGEQRSRGAEFDVSGRILPGWDIIANYAYVDARVTKDEDFLIGSRLPNVPLHQGSIWTTYSIQEGQLQGLGAGLGLYAQAQRNGVLQFPIDPVSGDNQVNLPGFVRLDGAVYYRKNEIFPNTNLVASLNIKNILGQRYFEGGQFREVIYPGAPLTVLASVKLEFN